MIYNCKKCVFLKQGNTVLGKYFITVFLNPDTVTLFLTVVLPKAFYILALLGKADLTPTP